MSIQRPMFAQPTAPPISGMAASPWSGVPVVSVRQSLPGFRPGAPYLGPRYQPQGPLSAAQVEQMRQSHAILLADRFCKDSIRRWGADEHGMKMIVKQVAREHLQPQFNHAVRSMALQKGLLVRDAGDVVDRELGGNFLTRFFKKAPRQTCHDYLTLGYNPHSSTPWEYRRYGMYRSGSDFVGVIKRHPAISFSVIAAVSYLGNRFPFIGATSGIGLIAWGGIVSAISEFKAAKLPDSQKGEKAKLYEKSGENLAAVLVTMPGVHGILEGTMAGFGRYGEVVEDGTKKAESAIKKYPKALWKATSLKNTSDEYKKLSKGMPSDAIIPDEFNVDEKKGSRLGYWINRGLFVAGLFDNVLLPFNWLADKLEDKD